MKNKQKGFIGIALMVLIALAAIGGGAYVYTKEKRPQVPIQDKTSFPEGNASDTADTSPKTSVDVPAKTESNPESETKAEVKTETQVSSSDPWALIEKIKVSAKAGDQAGINSLSYIQYPPCGSTGECDIIFGFLDETFSTIHKGDYPYRWEDSKQMILATEVLKSSGNSDGVSYTRNSLIFTKDAKGNLKFVTSATYSNTAAAAMADTDEDGLTDEQEACAGASQYRNTCKKTDPAKRDTDGDGWWDGVEARFK